MLWAEQANPRVHLRTDCAQLSNTIPRPRLVPKASQAAEPSRSERRRRADGVPTLSLTKADRHWFPKWGAARFNERNVGQVSNLPKGQGRLETCPTVSKEV